MLAALGATALARSALSPDRTGMREPLEMQLLAHLTLEAGGAGDRRRDGQSQRSSRRASHSVTQAHRRSTPIRGVVEPAEMWLVVGHFAGGLLG